MLALLKSEKYVFFININFLLETKEHQEKALHLDRDAHTLTNAHVHTHTSPAISFKVVNQPSENIL